MSPAPSPTPASTSSTAGRVHLAIGPPEGHARCRSWCPQPRLGRQRRRADLVRWRARRSRRDGRTGSVSTSGPVDLTRLVRPARRVRASARRPQRRAWPPGAARPFASSRTWRRCEASARHSSTLCEGWSRRELRQRFADRCSAPPPVRPKRRPRHLRPCRRSHASSRPTRHGVARRLRAEQADDEPHRGRSAGCRSGTAWRWRTARRRRAGPARRKREQQSGQTVRALSPRFSNSNAIAPMATGGNRATYGPRARIRLRNQRGPS